MKEKTCSYCGSPKKLSKKGIWYCSNICWTKEPWESVLVAEQAERECIMESEHGNWGCRD